MRTATRNFVLLFCLLAGVYPAMASHTAGGYMTYKFLGDSSGYQNYRITFELYADCSSGSPDAIAEDNPGYIAVYTGSSATTLYTMDSMFAEPEIVPVVFAGPCGAGSSASLCMMKRTFVYHLHLRLSTTGYTITSDRCCRNGAISNITDPSEAGSTYFCTIPPSGTVATNNSAVFTNFPPLVIADHEPLSFDHSATDADGDSLSYELCAALNCLDGSVVKPIPPLPPPYDNLTYASGLSFSDPMTCSLPLQIDAATGMLTGTPSAVGRYLISVACKEWRGGVIINTTRREFEFMVAPYTASSYHPDAGSDVSIFVGDSVLFSGSGASSYSWSPATYLSSSTIPDPVGHFPVAGTYNYTLTGISDSGCTGHDMMTVLVLEHSEFAVPNAFTPNADGLNDILSPIPVKNSVLTDFKVYNQRWELLYESQDRGWDGTCHGTKQPIGVYYWSLNYTDNTGAARQMQGSSTLVR